MSRERGQQNAAHDLLSQQNKVCMQKATIQQCLVPKKLFPYKEKGGFGQWYFWAYTAINLEAPKGLGGGKQITLK